MDLAIQYRGRHTGFFSLYLDDEIESGIEAVIELILKERPDLGCFTWLEALVRYGLSLDFAGIPHSTIVFQDGQFLVMDNFVEVGKFESLPDALKRFVDGHQKWFDTPISTQEEAC